MKKTFLYSLIGSGLLLLSTGCNEDWNSGTGTQGYFNPIVSLDANPLSSRSGEASRADGDILEIKPADLSLKLTATATGAESTWASISDYDPTQTFNVGNYTLEAYYGSKNDEGFDKPYIYGVTSFTIRENETTPVSLQAQLANSMVTIVYTEAFTNYFTSHSAVLKTITGNSIDYAADENRPVYVSPGNVIINVNVTKPNGVETTLQALSFAAEARHHYNVTVDVNGGDVNGVSLNITWNDSFAEETVELNLEDIESAPAPTLEADGFTSGDNFEVVVNTNPDNKLGFLTMAAAGLKSALLETSSISLKRQGWPESVDLLNTDASTRATLQSLGLTEVGLWKNPDKMAVLDLFNVIKNIEFIEGSDNKSTFTLTVTDQLGRTTEPISFTIRTVKVMLLLSNPSPVEDLATTMTVDLTYNGSEAKLKDEVHIDYKNERGTWDQAVISNVELKSRANSVYTLTITGLPSNHENVVLRARAVDAAGITLGESQTDVNVERKNVPPYDLQAVNDLGVFATYATLTAVKTLGNVTTPLSDVTLEMSTDSGSNYSNYNATVSGNSLAVSGLLPGTTYTARLAYNGTHSNTVTFTTEAAQQLQNGNMNDGWSHTQKSNGAANCDVWSAPTPWTTNNSTTTGSLKSGSSYSGVSAVTSTNDAHNGNAALISTVGYGQTTLLAGPSTFARGEMKYDSAQNSRPKSLSFYSKYTAYSSGETGIINVSILNASGNVIASGSKSLSASNAYSLNTISFNYPANCTKAASIKVEIYSTNVASPSKSNCASNANKYSYGSQLYIDDITLNY